LLTRVREAVTPLLNFIARLFHYLHISAFATTFLSLVFALLSAYAYFVAAKTSLGLVFAFIFLLLSGFFDSVDGALARLYGEVTKFGGFMDSLLDRVGEIAVYCGIILGGLCSLVWGLAALSASLLVSYTRARAQAEGVEIGGVGVGERPERILILAALTIVGWVELGVILVFAVAAVTVVHRALHTYRKLS